MTITIKSHEENGIYVTMEQREHLLVVEVCQCQEDNKCGYPITTSMVYSVDDKKNAETTYRRYVKKYCNKGGLKQ